MRGRDSWSASRRPAAPWGRSARRRPRFGVLGVLVVLAGVVGAGFAVGALLGGDPTKASRDFVYTLLDDIPKFDPIPPRPAPTGLPSPTSAPSPTNPAGPGPAGGDKCVTPARDAVAQRWQRAIANSKLVDGKEFSALGKIGGVPARWSCSDTIPVILVGKVPDGADAMFVDVVTRLAAKSGLPLKAERSVSHIPPREDAVVVYYAAPGEVPGTFAARGGSILGLGGARYAVGGHCAGVLGFGEVVLRNDVPEIKPGAKWGAHVLAHEIMHALGLGHSAPDEPEVMMPYVNEMWPKLGPGDSLALAALGCGEVGR